MALLNKYSFLASAYIRISSVEYHRDKKQLRIRVDIYATQDRKNKGFTEEYVINEKMLRSRSQFEAASDINLSIITKIVDKEAKKEKLSKKDRDILLMTKKAFAIAEKAKEIGAEKTAALVGNINRKGIFAVAYEYLKKLEGFEKAKNA